MKKYILLIAIILSAALLNACSGDAGKTTSNNSSNNQTASANSPSNMNVEAIQNGNANLVPANNLQNTDFNALRAQMETDKANANKPTPVPQLDWRPAPDNSQVTTTMNKQNMFLEIRQFKNHPTLSKVERTPEDGKVKVFLKNGKVMDLPSGKINNVLLASAQDILAAVGVAMPTPTPDASLPKTKEEAKKQQ